MISLNDKIAAQYLDILVEQKKLYEQVLDISRKEASTLKARPLCLGRVIELLHTKDTLINKIHNLEQSMTPLREGIQAVDTHSQVQTYITRCLQDIKSLLKQLLEKDMDNENLLKEHMPTPAHKTVNKQQAMKAYGVFAY